MNGESKKQRKIVEKYQNMQQETLCMAKPKEIFVLFHVQNEKFRGKIRKCCFISALPQKRGGGAFEPGGFIRFEFQSLS